MSPHGIVLKDGKDSDTSDALWRAGFRDDTRARVRVTERALRRSGEEFEDRDLVLGALSESCHPPRSAPYSPRYSSPQTVTDPLSTDIGPSSATC